MDYFSTLEEVLLTSEPKYKIEEKTIKTNKKINKKNGLHPLSVK